MVSDGFLVFSTELCHTRLTVYRWLQVMVTGTKSVHKRLWGSSVPGRVKVAWGIPEQAFSFFMTSRGVKCHPW